MFSKVLKENWSLFLIFPIMAVTGPILFHYAFIGGVAGMPKGMFKTLMLCMQFISFVLLILAFGQLYMNEKENNRRIWKKLAK